MIPAANTWLARPVLQSMGNPSVNENKKVNMAHGKNTGNRFKKLFKKVVKIDPVGPVFVAIFLLIGAGAIFYFFEAAIAPRVELKGKVESVWVREGTWDPNTKAMRQSYYFVRVATAEGTWDFDVVRSKAAQFGAGDAVTCVVGKGLFSTHPISVDK
jgi:hypothetical protein